MDHDDWRLNPAVFKELDIEWGPHSIDRFADMHNHQVQRFNSRYWNPDAEAVDTFTCDWSGEINWWCPPPFLIPCLLRHAQVTSATSTLVVPQWCSAPYVTCFGKTDHLRAFCILRNTNLKYLCTVPLLWYNTVTPDILYE